MATKGKSTHGHHAHKDAHAQTHTTHSSHEKGHAAKTHEKGHTAKTHETKDHRAHKSEPHVAAKNVTKEEAQFIREHADELSRTTQHAKWVHSADEHEDRPGQSLATRSHEVIKHWAEERGAQPATVPGTEHQDHAGVLRFNFPGFGGRDLQEIDWDEWFKSFDDRELVFVFQEHKTDGVQSNFFQLDNPNREHA